MTRAREIMAGLNKLLGSNVVSMASDEKYVVKYMSTGLLPFDIAFRGGLARGRFTTITGAYSTLKSYVGLKAIAAAQARGELCALIDTEHAFDPDWATEQGVNVDDLIVWPPLDSQEEATGEQAIDVAENLIRNKVNLIVFDSVAATLPQDESKKRLSKENIQPARLAALMSAAMRRLTAPNSVTAVLWINQLREQVGVTFGNPEKATGGRALPYYSSVIMTVRSAGKITEETKTFNGDVFKSGKRTVGNTYAITIEKSKLSTPWETVYFDFSIRDGGIDDVKFLFAQGVDLGFIKKAGNTWSYGKTLTAIGKDKFLKALAGSQNQQRRLEGAIRSHYGIEMETEEEPAPQSSSPRRGSRATARTKVGELKSVKSSGKALGRTPAQGPAASRSTRLPKKK